MKGLQSQQQIEKAEQDGETEQGSVLLHPQSGFGRV